MQDIHLLENHWLACMATAGGGAPVTRLPGAVVLSSPRFTATFLNFMTLRAVEPARLALTLEMGSAVLAGLQRFPAVFLSPAAGDMEALSATLRGLGWHLQNRQSVLSRELPLNGGEVLPNVSVREIGPGDLAVWGRVLSRAYEVPGAAGREIRMGWSGLMADPGEGCSSRYYLAFLEGRPVGTGLTWKQGEVAALYCGAVLPRFRRRGVERATVLRRLAQVASDGARRATLQTEVGSPVEHLCMDRLGFRVAYCRELWLPPGSLKQL